MMDASRLGFDPLIPWLALWALVGVAVALWGVYVFLRGKAWLFRALAMTVLAIALANPQWIQERAAERHRRRGDGPLREHELPRQD
jgi:hypothetical protein